MRDPKGLARMVPLLRLESQHLAVIDLLVNGLDRPLKALPDVPLGMPLSVETAATALEMRRAYIRRLLEDRLFKATYDKAVAAKRAALAPRAIQAIAELIDWQGHNEAADAGVRLKAAALALGDDAKGGLSVNVQFNNQLAIRPGYVVRLPPDAPLPQTIEGETADNS